MNTHNEREKEKNGDWVRKRDVAGRSREMESFKQVGS
jgi:hypothetical protein